MAISLTYLAFRTKLVVSTQETTLLIWTALAIEIATAVPRLFHQILILGTAQNAKGVRLPRSISNESKLPKIDVFITYCGEGVAILTDTVKAACYQDYPPSLLRVIILDDSSSRDVASAITELQPVVPPSLHYATRNVKHHTHSKATNLNFGLHFTDTLRDGSARYLAVLDVDMMPSPNWLRTVLPHLLDDPSAGLACPSQRFYNIAPNDPLGMTPDISLIESMVVLQDFADSSLCTGSGFLIRRPALDAINGFPEESLQEDLLTTMALSAKGFRTVYVDGELQWGLAADTFPDWIKQRQRWAAGVLSISSYLCSNKGSDIPFGARVSVALWGIIDGSASVIWTISLFLLPLLISSGRPLLPSSSGGATQSALLFRLAVLDFATQSAVQALICSLVDWRCDMLGPVAGTWMAPYRLLITLRFYCFPKLLGHKVPAFTPTGINAALGKEEREARKRGRSCKKIVLWDCGAWIFLAVLGCCLLGGLRTMEGALSPWLFSEFKVAGRDVLEGFLLRMGWPPLFSLWLLFAKCAWTPISYAFAPPPFVDREQLLDRTGRVLVANPKKNVKECYMKRKSQLFWLVLAAYYVILGVVFEGVR
ncbi:MAG: hypothetical protein L6R42_002556 [Xanthoria sp. 1 TBL-2021]|nr:MAG: hypothetical protein L6R42_002556 [Xanthoria sp. 1 TBL-2021]